MSSKFKKGQIVKIIGKPFTGELTKVQDYPAQFKGHIVRTTIISNGLDYFIPEEELILQHGVCVEKLTTRKK
jgi:transcription antitermination factor NusG